MEPDSSPLMALGRLEGKMDMLLSHLTTVQSRADVLDTRINDNDKRIASLEAKADARSDTGRFWLTTLSSGLAVLIAALALAKDFFK